MAMRQLEPFVAARTSIDIAFQRRRRAGEHDRTILDTRSDDCHIARMIDRTFFLLVGLLVFFIDDNEPKLWERQEE